MNSIAIAFATFEKRIINFNSLVAAEVKAGRAMSEHAKIIHNSLKIIQSDIQLVAKVSTEKIFHSNQIAGLWKEIDKSATTLSGDLVVTAAIVNASRLLRVESINLAQLLAENNLTNEITDAIKWTHAVALLFGRLMLKPVVSPRR